MWVMMSPALSELWIYHLLAPQFSSVQLLSHVQILATPWTAARRASLSITAPGVHSYSGPWSHVFSA